MPKTTMLKYFQRKRETKLKKKNSQRTDKFIEKYPVKNTALNYAKFAEMRDLAISQIKMRQLRQMK